MKKLHPTLSGIFVLLIFSTGITYSQIYPGGAVLETELPEWMLPSPPIKALAPTDDECDNSEHFPPIKNQSPWASCVAFSWAYYYKTYQEWEEGGWDVNDPNHQFSPSFIYHQINGGNEVGCYGSAAAQVLMEMGCATWMVMPYNIQWNTVWPSEAAFEDAILYRCEQVYYIDVFANGLDDVKNHLLNGHVAVFYILVYENLYQIQQYNYVYCLNDIYGPIIDGHAVTLCGFDDEMETADGPGAFKVANSWGTSWGDQGYFWISYQAMVSAVTSQGRVDYTTDKIDYQPTFITRLKVSHGDRFALDYKFGIGDLIFSDWSKNFFNYTIVGDPLILPYPESNMVLDLTEGAEFLGPGDTNVYMRILDERPNNGYGGQIDMFSAEELTIPSTAFCQDTPIEIPDQYIFVYAQLTYDGLSAPFEDAPAPEEFNLLKAYPNPFNPTTVISFELRDAGYVSLDIFDVTGRSVGVQNFEPLHQWMSAGSHSVIFDGGDLASGIYLARLEAGEYVKRQKLLLIK